MLITVEEEAAAATNGVEEGAGENRRMRVGAVRLETLNHCCLISGLDKLGPR